MSFGDAFDLRPLFWAFGCAVPFLIGVGIGIGWLIWG